MTGAGLFMRFGLRLVSRGRANWWARGAEVVEGRGEEGRADRNPGVMEGANRGVLSILRIRKHE
jgi:hypothetical protein